VSQGTGSGSGSGAGPGTSSGSGPEHERIEELLAGHALHTLSERDAADADLLLAEHVPTCPSCLRTVSDFRAVIGELALAADPVPPPDLVLGRIHRGIGEIPIAGGLPGRGSFVAFAVGVVALVAMGGLSFVMADRASEAQDDRSLALELLSLMSSPGVSPVSVDQEGSAASASDFVGVAAPDVRRFYLVADVCPEPAPGHAYQLWLGNQGVFEPVGEMFVPSGGSVLIKLTVDVARFDEVWITEEVASQSPPTSPSRSGRSWRASLA
jgi:anti-sigma-K factor RskA